MNYRTLTGEDMDAVASSENNSANVTAPHWGNHEDISDLECMLGIGILMFWKNKHAGQGRLFHTCRHDLMGLSQFIFLAADGDNHFELGGLMCKTSIENHSEIPFCAFNVENDKICNAIRDQLMKYSYVKSRKEIDDVNMEDKCIKYCQCKELGLKKRGELSGIQCDKSQRKKPYVIDNIECLLNRHCYDRICNGKQSVKLCQCNENGSPCSKQAYVIDMIEYALNRYCYQRTQLINLCQCNNNGVPCTKQARKEPYVMDEIEYLLNRDCYEKLCNKNSQSSCASAIIMDCRVLNKHVKNPILSLR